MNGESSLMADSLGAHVSAMCNDESEKIVAFLKSFGIQCTSPAWSTAVLSDILRHIGVCMPCVNATKIPYGLRECTYIQLDGI